MTDQLPGRLPTIEAQSAAFLAEMTAALPAGTLDPFIKDQGRLEREGIPADAAKPGTPFPDGEVLDAHGQSIPLSTVRGERPAVVVFYRGVWCPYCNMALRTYQSELLPDLRAHGVELIAISPQKPDGSLSSAQTNELTFSVVSDPGNPIAEALGIVMQPSDEVVAASEQMGMSLTDANADGSVRMPMPTVVVVDAAGVIQWIDVHPNYSHRSEVHDILAAVAGL